MVQTYRESELNYESVFKNMVDATADYMVKNGMKCMVLGISGGIDSTVSAAICKKVYEKTGIPLIGYSLPCSTNKDDENKAADAVGREFCNEYHVVNLQELFEHTEKVFNSVGEYYIAPDGFDMQSTKISQGNIKARIRGNFLHNVAGIRGGLVIDTDNLTEHFLGFWTICGGDEGEFDIIGGLWKNEVYGLVNWMMFGMNAPEEFAKSEGLALSNALVPTDGNGVSSSDLEQIAPGYTYDDVDHILQRWVGLDSRIKKDILKKGVTRSSLGIGNHLYDDETVKKVIMRSVNSGFKRAKRPFVVDIYRGLVTDKDGSIVSL